MALIVIPFMFGQLIIYTVQVFQEQSFFNVFGMIVVILLWLSTFLQFVPLHQAITNNKFSSNTLSQLVVRNWIRTALWSVLFIWSLVDVF